MQILPARAPFCPDAQGEGVQESLSLREGLERDSGNQMPLPFHKHLPTYLSGSWGGTQSFLEVGKLKFN